MVLLALGTFLGPSALAGSGLPPAPDARFALALYCNPTCDEAVVDTLDVGLSSIPARPSFAEVTPSPMRIMGAAGTEFGMPEAAFIEAYGVGVDRPEALAGSQEVLLAWIAAPRDQAAAVFATAHAAFAQAADVADGWVEDLDTQTVYGVAAYTAKRTDGAVTEWFVIDPLPSGADGAGPFRVVTRGLRRFGYYELVVPEVAEESLGDVAFVLNAIAEHMAFGGRLESTLTLDTPEVRGKATFAETVPSTSDPEAPLLRVSFQGEVGPPAPVGEPALPPPEPVADVMSALPVQPRPPEASPAPPPDAAAVTMALPAVPAPRSLDEARLRVREQLQGRLRGAWEAGLPAGDKLAVSVPFPTRKGGVEYIWVEVRSWSGDQLAGVLVNEPFDVAGFRLGDRADVVIADVYDYVWKHADGSREGNVTAPFVRR